MLRKIGKYDITGELGRGGFGAVYRAFDPTVGRDVAIKIMHPNSDESLGARFRAEASTAGNLHHRNIITVHEFGEENGMQYLVMEYLDGIDLQKIISKKIPLTLFDRVELMSQVARGLHCAHEHNVVHRDVKPANIMRLHDGTVKIMDFGIARILQDAGTRLTQAGFLVGTLRYMAPEQIEHGESDSLCDIWAFGVVFYELLTGVHPFESKDQRSMMYKITSQDPLPIRNINTECPPALEMAVLRLLRRRREERYQTLEDFVLDTEPLLADLGRAQLPDLLRSADELIQKDELDDAQSLIRRILELDATNQQARQWRDEIRTRARRRALQPRVDEAIRAAEAALEARDFAAALQRVEEAARIDPANTSARQLDSRIRLAEENARKAERTLAEAKRQLALEELTGAHEQVRQALAADPTNPEGARLFDEIKRALNTRQLQKRLREGLNQAKGFVLMQSYDEAIAVLEDLIKIAPGDPDVRNRLSEARRLRQDQLLTERVNAGINRSRELLKRGESEQAVAVLEDLQRQAPDQQSVRNLLDYAREQVQKARREAEFLALLRDAENKSAGQQYAGAILLVNKALQLVPGDERALKIQQQILEAQRAERERKAVESGLIHIRELCDRGSFDEALAELGRLAASYPSNGAIQDARRILETRIEEQRRREARDKIKEAEDLLAANRNETVERLVEPLTRQYPDEPEFRRLLEQARQAERNRRASEDVQAALQRAGSFASTRNWASAVEELSAALTRNPGNADLLKRLDQIQEWKVADETFAAIEKCEREGELDRAVQLAEAALRRNPNQPRMATVLEDLRQHRELADVVRLATRRLAVGDIEEASRIVTDARRRFPKDPELKTLEERVAQGGRREQQLLAARDALRANRFDEAQLTVDTLLAADPNDRTAQQLGGLIARQRKEYLKQQEYEKTRAEADALARDLKFDQAIGRLELLQQSFPDDASLRDAILRLREQSGRQSRQQEYVRGRAEAHAFSSQLRYHEAIETLRALLVKFPDDPALLEDLNSAVEAKRSREERLKRENRLRAAEECLNRGDPQAALRELEGFGAGDSDPRARELAERAARSARAQQEQKQAEAVRSEAERLVQAGKFDEAIAMLEDLGRKQPASGGISDEIARIRSAREQQIRTERYRSGRAEIERLLADSRFEAAIQRIRELMAVFPRDPALEQELKAATEAKNLQEQRLQFEAEVSAVEQLLAKAEWEPARIKADRLLAQRPDPRVKDQLERARQGLAVQKQQECDRGRAEAGAMIQALRFDEAIARLNELIRAFPDQRVLPGELARAKAAKQEFLGRQADAEARKEIESLRRQLRFDEAIARLKELAQRHPNDLALAQELKSTQEAQQAHQANQAVETKIAAIEELLKKGDAEKARSDAEQLLAERADPRARDQLDRARSTIELRRQQDCDRGRAEAIRLVQSQQFDAAISRLELLLKNYPEQPGIAEELERAKAAREQHFRHKAYLSGRSDVERLTSQSKWDEAISRINELLKHFPGDPALTQELKAATEAKRLIAQRSEIEGRIQAIEFMLEKGDAESARKTAEALLKERPDPRVKAQLERARQLMARRRQQRSDEGRAEASRLLQALQFDAAISRLEALAAEAPDEPGLAEELSRARLAKEKYNRNLAYQESRKQIDRLLGQGRLDEAVEAIRKLLESFPDDPALAQELNAVQQAKRLKEQRLAIEARIATIEALQKRGDAPAVLAGAEALLAEANEPRAKELLEWARKAIAFGERQRIDQARAQAEDLLRQQRFDEAISAYEHVLQSFPNDAGLRDDLSRAKSAKDQFQRGQAYAQGLERVEQLAAERRLDDVIGVVRRMLQEFPEDPVLLQHLKSATDARQLREQRNQIDGRIAELEQLFRAGNAAAVKSGAKQLLREHNELRARELLDWAEKTLADAGGLRRQTRPRPDPKILIGGVVLSLVAVAAVVTWSLLSSPKLPVLEVNPQSVDFEYQVGSPLPKPKPIDLQVKNFTRMWKASGQESWLTIDPVEGSGSSRLNLVVNPAGLKRGEYTAVTSIGSADGAVNAKPVRVHLVVTEPAGRISPAASIDANPTALEFSYQSGGALPPARQLNVRLNGVRGGWTATGSAHWVSLSPARDNASAVITVHVNPSGLAAGEHTTVINILSSDGSTAAKPVRVHLTVSATSGNVDRAKPDPPRENFPDPIDCHKDYYGKTFETMHWTGELAPKAQLTFTRSTVAPGKIGRSYLLPGCEVEVTSGSDQLTIEEKPSPANKFGKLVLRNNSETTVTSAEINWKVK